MEGNKMVIRIQRSKPKNARQLDLREADRSKELSKHQRRQRFNDKRSDHSESAWS